MADGYYASMPFAAPGADYGMGLAANKGSIKRKRLNNLAILVAVMIPCAFFAALVGLFSFQVYEEHAGFCYFFLAIELVITLMFGLRAFAAKWSRNPAEEDYGAFEGFLFMFVSCLIAILVGSILGTSNFAMNMQKYYDYRDLGVLSNATSGEVDPAGHLGKQYMDAGAVYFSPGSYLDLSRAIGFKDNDIYCVAPISNGDAPLANYDFWAVGVNCCNGFPGDFYCEDFNSNRLEPTRAGLRLLNDDKRPYYRLATQQAEAEFGIRTSHPIFFEWMQDPSGKINDYNAAGWWTFGVGVGVHFVLQVVFTFAVLYFFLNKRVF